MQFEISAYEVEDLLDRAPAGIEILSLDCFDTLIWRNTHSPKDVFSELDLPGISLEARVMAEGTARRRAFATRGAKEIGLHEVYDFLYPSADAEFVADAVARELALEASHAFAFEPTVRLIHEAKRRGLKVAIVSDMYLSEARLRGHIAAAAGEDLLDHIDHLFVSAAYGMGKGDGLFDQVVKTLGVAADKILHVGDNRTADYVAAARHGLHAAHLRQFDDESQHRLRMEAMAAQMLDPGARTRRAICQAHRAQTALRRPADAATALGHDVIGPVTHAFALWVKAELDEMSARLGRPVKPLFVMRDGYLPWRVFDALFPEMAAGRVEISRFVAFRASIKDSATLDYYLAEWMDRLPIQTMARQLMLFDHEFRKIAKGDTEEQQRTRFFKAVRSSEYQRKIVTRCKAFAGKLMAHVAAAGVERGDAVMLIDIGYNGTVQNIITPVLRDEMALEVSGRYLFLREAQISGLDKRGMLDVRNYDYRALHALSSSVVVIEQLCNIEQGSTIDFDKDGTPIREAVDAKAPHSEHRAAVQAACLTYVAEAGRGTMRAPRSDTLESRCRAAAASLARLFFLPNASEVELFQRFDFDMNMGTTATGRLVDTELSRNGLRRHGVSFFADQRRTSFLSAELHDQGMATGLGMFAAQRFGLDLRVSDFQAGSIEMPTIIASATDHVAMNFSAWPTVEGYYRMQLPVATGCSGVGLQIGRVCEWVQLEELSYTPIADLQKDVSEKRVFTAKATPDAIEAVAGDLYRVEPEGLLFVAAPPVREPCMLSLVFRPVRLREKVVELRAAA